MLVLGIDPGPTTSGIVLYDSAARRVLHSDGKATLERIMSVWLSTQTFTEHRVDLVVVEQVVGMGQAVAGETFITCENSGRCRQRAIDLGRTLAYTPRVAMLPRRAVLKSLGVTRGQGSSDSRVTRRLIDLHGGPNDPKARTGAKGYKDNPGPLYGVTSHAWQALGLAYIAINNPAGLNGQ